MKSTKLLLLLLTFLLTRGLMAQTPPALPPLPAGEQLDAWLFQDTNWLSVFDDAPLSFTNLVLEADWAGNGLLLDDTNAAFLNYAVISPDGWTNISFSHGSISFWFSPDWNTSDGIGNWGTLLEVGSWNTNGTGAWGLYISPDGANLYFSAQTNGFSTNYLNAPISWNAGDWHQITLTYTATNSSLYLEGQLVTNGPGVNMPLGSSILTNGFSVGSDGNASGLLQARGMFNELETFDYPLDPISISNNYAWVSQNVYPLPSSGFHHDTSPTPPGDGSDYTNTPTGDLSGFPAYGSNDFWIQALPLGTNQYNTNIGTLTLLLHATVAKIAYQLLSTTNIQTTNTIWTLEQTVIGADITNFTVAVVALSSNTPAKFFKAIAATFDTDGDGLPDWWENAYSTGGYPLSPTNADTGNTGVADGYKQDAAGDGYNNLQKYQMGVAPNVFVTPPAPTVTVAPVSGNTGAVITWLPSPGVVTNYAIIRNGVVITNLASTQTSYQDNTGTFSAGSSVADYQVRADYAGGHSLLSSPQYPYPIPFGISTSVARGPNGQYILCAPVIPTNVFNIFVFFEDQGGEYPNPLFDDYRYLQGPNSYDPDSSESYFEISVTNFVNGLYAIPKSYFQPYGSYLFACCPLGTNSSVFGPTELSTLAIGDYPEDTFPFLDGSVQLKQNLMFTLEAADENGPFSFSVVSQTGGYGSASNGYPASYALASFHFTQFPGGLNANAFLDIFKPFEDNYMFANFVYSPTNVNSDGSLASGVGYENFGDYYTPDAPVQVANNAPSTFGVYSFVSAENTNAPSALLSTNSQWIYSAFQPYDTSMGNIGVTEPSPYDTLYLTSGQQNIFGLPYQSAYRLYNDGTTLHTDYLPEGGNIPDTNDAPEFFYGQVAPPHLVTVGYYFGVGFLDPLPGNAGFSPTNTSPLMIGAVGRAMPVTGWAKQQIANGNTNMFGFLEQYFDKAYLADTNGNITTNQTGILSEYGEFMPTQPGQVFLTTKPDVITGQQGTNVVNVIKMVLDANHDGVMDLSFSGADNTTADQPFKFWINSDWDANDNPSDPGYDVNNPYDFDYNLQDVHSQRDLEDFARLWICGMPALPTNYQATLSWNVISGNPAIHLLNAVETNGGTGYLTNTSVAAAQAVVSFDGSGNPYGPGFKFASVTTNQPYTFSSSYFASSGNKYLLFEGAGIGQGELVLTVTRGTNIVGKTTVFISLKEVKDMFEHAEAQNVTASIPPSSLVSSMVLDSVLPPDPTEAKQMTVFVHGINNTPWEAENTSETIFKRLYWAGYTGRFATFRWPCAYLPPTTVNPFHYNLGEFFAWKSAAAFKDYLTYLRNNTNLLSGYKINVIAHSQGNVVASEALEQGAPFDNYILSQGAIPAQCYDVNTNDVPFLQKFLDAETTYGPTPLDAVDGGYEGYLTNLSGNIINFYNTNDFALATGTTLGLPTNWEENQRTQKPESFALQDITYYYSPSSELSYKYVGFTPVSVTDGQEIKSMIARSRSHAIGAQNGAHGVIKASVDLAAQFGFGNTRPEHSAEFTRPIQTAFGYYQTFLIQIQPAP